jgi:HK97 family phage portal protein
MSFMTRAREILGVGQDRSTHWRAAGSTFDDENWSQWGSWSSKSVTGIQINQTTAMSCAAVMACVSILSEDVAKLPPTLYDVHDDGSRTRNRKHPTAALLRQPNAWQTWMEFAGQMQMGLVLRGNAYAIIVRAKNGYDPAFLVPINPDRVSLWESPDGSLFWMVSRTGLHEMAVLRDVPLLVPDYDMFHLKGLSSNGLLGFSKIALNREAIGLALGQEQQAARWMKNAARPGGILTTEQKLSDDVAARSKANWQAAQTGLENSGKTAVLEMGLKWQPLTMSAQDMEFIASRTFQKEEIASIFRVPPHMIGVQSRGQNQNITQQSQDYFNNTLSTYTEVWRTRWAFTFGLPDGTDLDFDRSILLAGDIVARFQMYRIGLQGVLSTNDCRRFEKLGPAPEGDDVPAGDKVFRAVNMTPVDSDVFQGLELPGGQNKALSGPGSDGTGSAPAGAGNPDSSDPDPDQSIV